MQRSRGNGEESRHWDNVTMPREDDPHSFLFFVAVFVSSGLKIKCPVLALIVPVVLIFIRVRLRNLPDTL